VKTIRGYYGEYTVLVDDETAADRAPKVIRGVMPSARQIVDTVRARLAA
jgi:hypothetical protein